MEMRTATLEVRPMFNTRDDAGNTGRFDGKSALIWKISEELSGDAPAYSTLAILTEPVVGA
jgi:hypothetical protein